MSTTSKISLPNIVLVAIAAVSLQVACSGSDTPASSNNNSNAPAGSGTGTGTGSSSGGGPSQPSTPGAQTPVNDTKTPSCKTPEDCPNWYCECESGPPVNSRHCTNGKCENAAEACPSACAGFKTCWKGTAGGGWKDGTNTGPSTCGGATNPGGGPPTSAGGCGDQPTYTDVGKGCTGQPNTACQSLLCYGQGSSYVCTKRCDDESNCPAGWRCTASGQLKICMQGTLTSTPVSTNTNCAEVAFTDVGASCAQGTQCQSGMCFSFSGVNACTRRCNDGTDCPSGMYCTQAGNESYKICAK